MEPLLFNFGNLLQVFLSPTVKNIFRETNQCAEALAKFGAMSVTFFVIFDNLENLLVFDKAKLFCNRMVFR
jgi:hypothetical protein